MHFSNVSALCTKMDHILVHIMSQNVMHRYLVCLDIPMNVTLVHYISG